MPRERVRLAFPPDPAENWAIFAAYRKSPSVKQWTALILFLGICAWILAVGIENYREYRSMEHSINLLASECANRGGCTLLEYDF